MASYDIPVKLPPNAFPMCLDEGEVPVAVLVVLDLAKMGKLLSKGSLTLSGTFDTTGGQWVLIGAELNVGEDPKE